MAILKVARLGHPVLRKVAEPVPVKQIRPETQRLIDDMVETMREYNGAGLAAPQVHTLQQICVIEANGNPRHPDAASIPLTLLINPVVTPMTAEMDDGWEGCSRPGYAGLAPRYAAVHLEAYGRDGERIDTVAKEFFARVIQHETDHLRGIVDVDRMCDLSMLTHLAQWNKHWLGNHDRTHQAGHRMTAEEFVPDLQRPESGRARRPAPDATLAPEVSGDLDVPNLLKVALKNEIEATEIAARWLTTTDDVEVKMAFARQAGDEAKHYRMIADRLRELGVDARGFNPLPGLWSALQLPRHAGDHGGARGCRAVTARRSRW